MLSGSTHVDIAGKEDLTTLLMEGIGNMFVVVLDGYTVKAGSMTSGHAEIGQGGGDGDQGGDNMEETLRHRDVPG